MRHLTDDEFNEFIQLIADDGFYDLFLYDYEEFHPTELQLEIGEGVAHGVLHPSPIRLKSSDSTSGFGLRIDGPNRTGLVLPPTSNFFSNEGTTLRFTDEQKQQYLSTIRQLCAMGEL